MHCKGITIQGRSSSLKNPPHLPWNKSLISSRISCVLIGFSRGHVQLQIGQFLDSKTKYFWEGWRESKDDLTPTPLCLYWQSLSHYIHLTDGTRVPLPGHLWLQSSGNFLTISEIDVKLQGLQSEHSFSFILWIFRPIFRGRDLISEPPYIFQCIVRALLYKAVHRRSKIRPICPEISLRYHLGSHVFWLDSLEDMCSYR